MLAFVSMALLAANYAANAYIYNDISSGNATYHDMVEDLPSYEELIEDPDEIKSLMETQGYTDVDYVEVGPPLGGGTTSENHEGYIYWTNGTSTKVVIKGSRSGETYTDAYREPMYYSRLSKSLEPELNVVDTYLTLIDVDEGSSFMIEQFMTGYTSFKELLQKTDDELEELGCSEFNIQLAIGDSMSLLARFHAKGWMDYDLDSDDYFFLKTYGWTRYEGQTDFDSAQEVAQENWTRLKQQMDDGETDLVATDQLREITDRVFELYSWNNTMDVLHDSSYRWGNVHGDYQLGQMMYQCPGGDEVLMDWEFSGFAATPAIDVTYFSINALSIEERRTYEDYVLTSYWHYLAKELGLQVVDDYPFETFKHEFLTYGFSNQVLLWMGYMDNFNDQTLFDKLDAFITDHSLTVDDVLPPVYAFWQ